MKFYCSFTNSGVNAQRCDDCKNRWFSRPPCTDFPRELAQKFNLTDRDLDAAGNAWYILRERGAIQKQENFVPSGLPQPFISANLEDYKYEGSAGFFAFLKAIRSGEVPVVTLETLRSQNNFILPAERPIVYLHVEIGKDLDWERKYSGGMFGKKVVSKPMEVYLTDSQFVSRNKSQITQALSKEQFPVELVNFGGQLVISLSKTPYSSPRAEILLESNILNVMGPEAKSFLDRMLGFCTVRLLHYEENEEYWEGLLRTGVLEKVARVFKMSIGDKQKTAELVNGLDKKTKVIMGSIVFANFELLKKCMERELATSVINLMNLADPGTNPKALLDSVLYCIERSKPGFYLGTALDPTNLSLFPRHFVINALTKVQNFD